MDLQICIYVVLLCAGAIWDFRHVAAETVTAQTPDVVDILLDIRSELDNLKLSNDRNERKILRLERQVGECHTKYAELTKQTSSVALIEHRLADIEHKVEASHEELLKRLEARIENGLADIEHEVEASHEELLKRLEAMETSRTTYVRDIEHEMTETSGTVDEDGAKMNLDAGKMKLDADKNNFYADDEDKNGSEMTDVKGRNKRIIPVTSRPTTHTKVAFSAYISYSTVHSLDHNILHIIPFDSYVTNEGLAFNPTRHTFICPVNGVYFFTSAFAGSFLEHVYASIMKNGDRISDIDSGSQPGYNQGDNSVVVVCNKGDSIWVRVSGIVHSTVHGLHFTTFAGFLMWEL